MANAEMVIEFRRGEASLIKGAAPKIFLGDCAEILTQNGLSNGFVYLKKANGHRTLFTSGNIPAAVTQQLRNVWHLMR